MESTETVGDSLEVQNSMESSMNSTETSPADNMNVENSMETVMNTPSTESVATNNETLGADTILENTKPNSDNNEQNSIAESPAAKGRSQKQKEADDGAADILERMRNLYSREFADIPEKKRPKPPAWAARAALYKEGEDREEYIQNMLRNARNSLIAKSSSDYNNSLGNNADMLIEQLVSALDTASKVARQLKNVTRKGKRVSGRSMANNATSRMNTRNMNNSNMNMENNSMNVLGENNMNENIENNMNNMLNTNNNNNKPTRRVSQLSSKSKRQTSKKRSKFNEPLLTPNL